MPAKKKKSAVIGKVVGKVVGKVAGKVAGKKITRPKQSKMVEKSWHGRLQHQADAETARLLSSVDIDIQLWRHDISGSLAHAQMLAETGIITNSDFAKIKNGLLSIARDLRDGKLKTPVELEDIHMVIEDALIKRTGDAGRKLHTARSRNDQVSLDLRMWAKESCDELTSAIIDLQREFVCLAEREGETVFSAYTHLQRAQPIVLGAVLLAYVEMLQRDVERIADAKKRTDVCPLGCGAVAGTSLPIDRKLTAKLLEFAQVSRNSIDSASDRDFLAELCFVCAMVSVHLSRWAEDWIIQSTTEFGLVKLHDAYCTSSSMMPQKKNADTLELIRGKSATTVGNLTGILTLLKGLPLSYNRDMQDDKRFAFASVLAILQAIRVAAGIVRTVEFDKSKISDGIDDGFPDATSMAEYLVRKNVPFRQAHIIVGQIVAMAEKENKTLSQIPLTALQKMCGKFSSDVFDCLGSVNVANGYASQGAAGAKQLKKQLAFWKRKLK